MSSECESNELKMYEEYLLRLQRRKLLMENQKFQNYPRRKLEHICQLNVYQDVRMFRSTKIICALGKSSNNEEIILQMMRAGMSVARLNVTSLGFEQTTDFINMIRKTEEIYFRESKQRVAIAIDIAAPTARIGNILLKSGGKEIFEGESVWFTTKDDAMDTERFNIIVLDVHEFPMMIRYFMPRSRLYIDDGALTVIVRENYGECVRCLVEQGGVVTEGSTVNFLWSQNFLYHCADKYMKTITFVNNSDVDMVMLSFIRDASSIVNIKSQFKNNIAVIMKIENYINPDILDGIIKVSDGILIARGLIGIDLPIEKVFVLQNQIIAKCLKYLKPVFVGFQMLESMVTKPRPTRAEATDVANAVLTSVDGLVLGKETAKGNYVVNSIETMDKISLEAEATTSNINLYHTIRTHVGALIKGDITEYSDAASVSAIQASYDSRAKAIIVLTETGGSAFKTAALRPDCLILVVSRNLPVVRQCLLYKGILALWYNEPPEYELCKEMDKQLISLLQWAKDIKILKVKDLFVCVTGRKLGKGHAKTVRILHVPENLETLTVSAPVTDYLSKEILH